MTRTRVVKAPEERKTEILDAAEALFLKKGYGQTSVEDILRRLKLSKGGFYHHFASKEELLDEIVARHIEEIHQNVHVIADRSGLGAVKKIELVFDYFMGFEEGHSGIMDYFHEEKNKNLHDRIMMNIFEKTADPFAQIIMKGIEEGRFSTNYPREVGEVYFMTVNTLFERHKDQFWDPVVLAHHIGAAEEISEKLMGADMGTFRFFRKLRGKLR